MTPDQKNLELLMYRLEQSEKAVENLEREFKAWKSADAREKRSFLIWGIAALGFLVATLFGVIWTFRNVIFRGIG